MRSLSNHLPPNTSKDLVIVMIRGDWISLCELTNEMNPNHPTWRVGAVSPDIYHVDSKGPCEPPHLYLRATCPYGIAEESWREISKKYPNIHIQCLQQTAGDEWDSHLFIGGKELVDHARVGSGNLPTIAADLGFNEAVETGDILDTSNDLHALMMRRPTKNWAETSTEIKEAWAIPAPPWLPLPNQTIEAATFDFIHALGALIHSKSVDEVDKLCAARRIIDVTHALFSNGHSDAVKWLGAAIPTFILFSASTIFSATLASSNTQTAEVFALAYATTGRSLAELFPLVELAYIAHRRPDNLSVILANATWGYAPAQVEAALGGDGVDSRLLSQIQQAAIAQEFNSTRLEHEERESKRL